MRIKNISDLSAALKEFDYTPPKGAKFLATGSEQVVVKSADKIIHFIGLGYTKLDHDDVDIAIKEMKKYFQSLKNAGLTVAKPNFDCAVFEKPFPLIVVEDRYAGTSVELEMNKSNDRYLEIFEKLTKETVKAVKNKVPMDSSAKNYVINEKGKVAYIDFFKPYTPGWLFLKDRNKEYRLFTVLNFFVPNCELSTFTSKAIIKRPELKREILDIVYSNIDGKLLEDIKTKFESEEYSYLLKNHERLMKEHTVKISDKKIYEKIGTYDKTKKLLLDGSKIKSSSLSIMELYKKIGKNYIARPYNCLLWNKKDIQDAIKIMKKN